MSSFTLLEKKKKTNYDPRRLVAISGRKTSRHMTQSPAYFASLLNTRFRRCAHLLPQSSTTSGRRPRASRPWTCAHSLLIARVRLLLHLIRPDHALASWANGPPRRGGSCTAMRSTRDPTGYFLFPRRGLRPHARAPRETKRPGRSTTPHHRRCAARRVPREHSTACAGAWLL